MWVLDCLDVYLQVVCFGEDWIGLQQFFGDNLFGMGEGIQVLVDIVELEQLVEQLLQSYLGVSMDDVDLDVLVCQFGDQVVVDVWMLVELECVLVNQGFLDCGFDGQWWFLLKVMCCFGEMVLCDVV